MLSLREVSASSHHPSSLSQQSFKARMFLNILLWSEISSEKQFSAFCQLYTLVCYYLLQQFYSSFMGHNESLNSGSGGGKDPFDACEPTPTKSEGS